MIANPWRGVWHVLFMDGPLHPFMKMVRVNRPGFAHVLAMQPVGDHEHWLGVEWTLQGLMVRPCNELLANRMHRRAMEGGGILEARVGDVPRPRLRHSFVPTTCCSVVRQVLAMPPKWHFWERPQDLYGELLARGAGVLIPPAGECT